MNRIIPLSIVAFLGALGVAHADQSPNDRLLIVNGNSGRVIYDDGRNDLFCVTRTHFVGYNRHGYRLYRRSMRCR